MKVEYLDQKVDWGRLPAVNGAAFDSYKNENRHAECLPGTRIELLYQIEEWAESLDGKCIFWLNGMAGTGKSTVSRTVASRLKQKNSLGASFFFKRGEEDQGNAKRLFPTLVRQLAIKFPQLTSSIQKTINDDPLISEKSLGEQFDKLLLRPLLNLEVNQMATIVIVIDALDECESEGSRDDVRTILQLLPRVQTAKSFQLRFFLTSRPELPIRLGFRSINGDYQDLDLHEVPKPDIEHDISKFLQQRLKEIQQDRSLPEDWLGETKIDDLVAISVPLFIFAVTICRILEDEQWPVEESLSEILAHQTDNSHLGGTYLPVLNRLLIRQAGEKRERLAKEYHKMLGTIILLENPLSISSLAVLMGISKESISIRLNSLHSVLKVPPDDFTPIRLFHLSFRDFLLDPNTREKTELWIDGKEMHKRITIQCLKLMQQKLRKNICDLRNSCIKRSEISILSINDHLSPALQYACRYWTQHLAQSQDLLAQLVEAFSFLEEHFLHWLEVMSLLSLSSEVLGMIKNLQLVIPVSRLCSKSVLYYVNTKTNRAMNILRFWNFSTTQDGSFSKIVRLLMLHPFKFIPQGLCLLQKNQ